MSEENRFGDMLRKFRVRRGKLWTQEYTAERLDVATHTYSDWETGKRIPLPKHRTKIAALFKLKQEEADALYRAAGQVPPEVNTLPFPQNPFFTGRERQLQQLAHLLKQYGSVAVSQPIAVSGLGGVGKTQLALEYAHNSYQKKMYKAVFWVNATDKTTLQRGYDDLAHMLELPERTERELDRRVQAVKKWLEGCDEWLLILDNADDLQLARSFLPVTSLGGHIVLTTRSQIVGTVARRIEIDEMEPAEGLLFLLKRAGMVQDESDIATVAPDVRESAIKLVTLLGGHPLALDQVGAYVEETEASLTDYIEIFHEERRSLLDRRGSSKSKYGDHPESVVATVTLTVRKACEQQSMVADILYFCSFLQPDAIPEELLLQADALKLDKISFREIINALKRYSLIKRNKQEKTFSMHRLVQAVIIDTLSPELKTQWRERVVRALNSAFPEVEFKEWARCGRMLPHALIAATWTETELTSMPDTSQLFLKAGIYLREPGQYAEAVPLLVRTLSITEQNQGTEHPDTARSVNNLASLYRLQGKYDLAEPLFQRALAIREKHLEAEHPETARSMNSLAILYRQQGKYEQAEPLYQRALSIFKQQLGAEHYDTVMCMNNLAELYRHQSKYEQAELLCRQVLAIREQHLGAEHPDTAKSLTNLANCYWDQKKYKLAEPLYQRVLVIFKKQLGAEHPDTASGMNNLAEFYWYQGKYEQAETLYEQALAIREQQLGTEHLATARSLHGLARLLHDQGKHEQAEALYQRALNIQEQRLGIAHPHTQETRKDYVTFLRSMGRDTDAMAVESRQEQDTNE